MVTRRAPAGRTRGFTLVEMLMVIIIIGILVPVVAVFIVTPIQGYIGLNTRADLTDAADSALHLMSREIRSALPNSVRTGTMAPSATPNAIEFIDAIDGGRYRANPGPGATDTLHVGAPDNTFLLIGAFYNLPIGTLPSGDRLVVYNLGAAGYNAYTAAGNAGVMTSAANQIALGAINAATGEQLVTLTNNHTFPAPGSPRQRIFVVDGPVEYRCENGAIRRYSGYGYHAAINTATGWPVGTSSALAANYVTDCNFSYTPGTATRSGVVTLSIGLSRNGETVNLLRQVRVDNAS